MKVKKSFLEKKIDRYRDLFRNIPSIYGEKVQATVRNVSIFLCTMRYCNLILGDWIIFEDDTHYNSKTLEFYNTAELYRYIETKLMNKDLTGECKEWEDALRRFPLLQEFKYIDPEYLQKIYLEQIQKENDNKVAELINKNKDVVYLRDQKFYTEYGFESSTRYSIADIPLEKFGIFCSHDISEIAGEGNLQIISGYYEFTLIDRHNMDDIVNDFFCDNGYVSAKDREGYEMIYNNIYSGKENMYLVTYNTFFPSDYINIGFITDTENTLWIEKNTNRDMQIEKDEIILYGFEKRLAYICNYFKNLDDYGQIDLRVFEGVKKSEGMKSHRKIEERASTIVKSHIRRYKTGKITIVRSYIRKGINYDKKGLCVTI